ncbi:MAG: heme peroxidase, partial [Chloroflexi bacterium]|nr:heme peroxidase [Chloroflexota bacterium]
MRRAWSGSSSGVLGLVVGVATARLLGRRFSAGRSGQSVLKTLAVQAGEALDRTIGWDKLPLPLTLFTFYGLREKLRAENLYDPLVAASRTSELTPLATPSATHAGDAGAGGEAEAYLVGRTADGTFNDLRNPTMGSAGTRFGRNVPLQYGFPEPKPAMLTPNPRVVSLELLARQTFVPATTLNLLAASWLQFMIRDWLSHGKSPADDPWEIPIPPGDDWPEPTMRILRTPDDPTRTAADSDLPPTHINTETHWWDGSQLYGSSKEIQMKVRSGTDGKLKVDEHGLPPADPDAIAQPGFWIGLGMWQVLFTLEHNAICDRLLADYPTWTDEDIFQRARLINAALLAKIHTVEWTPAIINNPRTLVGMRANWWGLETERVHRAFGRLTDNEALSGIPGGHQDHFGVPYALTEEFVAVYKMHALIPDDYSFRSAADDSLLQERTFPQVANQAALELLGRVSPTDLFYSFGTSHPGAIQLHNYPRSLQR